MNAELRAVLVDAELALPRWRHDTGRGAVATASWDEDAVTLAATAGLAVVGRNPEHRPRALATATVSAPLAEPGIAPYLVEVLGLQAEPGDFGVHVTQLGGSVAAGAGAVVEAMALLAVGMDPVLVVASDARRDSRDRSLGDGAVALLLSSSGEGGELEHLGSAAELVLDRWRQMGEQGVQTGDRSLDRFGPLGSFTAGVSGERTQVISTSAHGPSLPGVGFIGCPAPLAALLAAEPGDASSIDVVSSAGGMTYGFRFTPGPDFDCIAKGAVATLAAGEPAAPPRSADEQEFDPYASQSMARRERGQTYRLEARKDPSTGAVIYPPPPEAAAQGLEAYQLRRTGTVVTFARDHVFPVGGPLTMAVVDLDGGGRFYGQVVDGRNVEVGDRVALTLRRLHQGGHLPHYFWKVEPIEGSVDADRR